MPARFTAIPDERFKPLHGALEERLRLGAGAIAAEGFAEFVDPVMRAVLTEGFRRAGGDEGTVWLLDEPGENLVAAFNSGPRTREFVGRFRQSLRAGMISMVFATEQPICENEVFTNTQQDKTLDDQLGLRTCSMVAVPLYFGRELRGVISCVQLRPADSPPHDCRGFTVQNVGAVQLIASVLSRLIDHHLLALTVGWDHA